MGRLWEAHAESITTGKWHHLAASVKCSYICGEEVTNVHFAIKREWFPPPIQTDSITSVTQINKRNKLNKRAARSISKLWRGKKRTAIDILVKWALLCDPFRYQKCILASWHFFFLAQERFCWYQLREPHSRQSCYEAFQKQNVIISGENVLET